MKYKKNYRVPNNQDSFNLSIPPSPLVPHIEGNNKSKVVITRIPLNTDLTKRDLALQKAINMSKYKNK